MLFKCFLLHFVNRLCIRRVPHLQIRSGPTATFDGPSVLIKTFHHNFLGFNSKFHIYPLSVISGTMHSNVISNNSGSIGSYSKLIKTMLPITLSKCPALYLDLNWFPDSSESITAPKTAALSAIAVPTHRFSFANWNNKFQRFYKR